MYQVPKVIWNIYIRNKNIPSLRLMLGISNFDGEYDNMVAQLVAEKILEHRPIYNQ